MRDTQPPRSETAVVITARGTLALERRLLDDLRGLLRGFVPGAGALERAVRLVVPSRWLRDHLSVRLTERYGPALLGVSIHTLRGAARDILDRAAVGRCVSEALFGLLARREIERERELAGRLGGFESAAGLAVPAVRDLLSAGFSEGSRGVCESRLETLDDQRRAPVCALLRAAAHTSQALSDLGAGRGEDDLARACGILESRGPGAWPSRAVLIYGIDDATGLGTDFVGSLVKLFGARVYLSRPDDPAAPGQPEAGAVFSRAFAERMGALAPCRTDQAPPVLPVLKLFDAAGAEGEVREVAARVRALLDSGVEPERIAVVARSLERYIVPVAWHFDSMGIPFSGEALAPDHSAGQRHRRALLRLLRDGRKVPLGVWLEAWTAPQGGAAPGEIHLSRDLLRRRALEKLGDLSDWGRRSPDNTPDRSPSERRQEDDERMAVLCARATALVECLESWPERDTLANHVGRLETLCREHLGMTDASLLDGLSDLPLEVARDELILLLEAEARERKGPPLGGAGRGVRVLAVEHARGLTHAHLFLMGLNRGVFPRPVHEDPLLRDGVRRRLQAVIPSLSIKRSGFAEERFLFAALLSSATHATLSWQRCDEDGTLSGVSPLVERLRLVRGNLPYVQVPRWLEASTKGAVPWSAGAPCPASEAFLAAGLMRGGRQAGWILERAFREVARAAGSEALMADIDPARLAEGRLRLLDEIDPDLGEKEGRLRDRTLGPYHGFAGPMARPGKEAGRLFVTRLESLARCPWQYLLTRELRLERVPDSSSARFLADRRLLGDIVHGALQRLVSWQTGGGARGRSGEDRAGGAGGATGDLEGALRRPPRPLRVPREGEVDQAVEEALRDAFAQEGVAPRKGVAAVLAGRARACIERAIATGAFSRAADRRACQTLGVELQGEVSLDLEEDTKRSLGFRVDRVDSEEERLVFIDFKTGRPFTSSTSDKGRHNALLAGVRQGRLLQGPLYLRARGGRPAEGRYWYLGMNIREGLETLAISSDDDDVARLLDRVLARLVAAHDAGILPPRLIGKGSKQGRVCDYCEVTEACLRGDSGTRRRLMNVCEDALRSETRSGRMPGEEVLVARLLAMEEGVGIGDGTGTGDGKVS